MVDIAPTLSALAAVLMGLATLISSIGNRRKLEEVRVSLNGKLEAWMVEAKKAAFLAGIHHEHEKQASGDNPSAEPTSKP